MGILDSVRSAYFGLEDKYYNFLDWLDGKGIPVYTVVEPMDKVLPSFIVFSVLFLAIFLAGCATGPLYSEAPRTPLDSRHIKSYASPYS